MTYCTCILSCLKDFISSCDKQSGGGQVYMQEAPVPKMDENNAATLEMSTVSGDANEAASKRKKKVIYFADGSTMEDYDDDDDDSPDNNQGNGVETRVKRSVADKTESAPPVDTSGMNWPEYVRHMSSRAGTKTLSVLEGMGGTAAYYLGITTPKYQSEIDEYNRMIAKKKSQEEELVSWSTGPKTQQGEPVVEDIKKGENVDGEIIPTEEK